MGTSARKIILLIYTACIMLVLVWFFLYLIDEEELLVHFQINNDLMHDLCMFLALVLLISTLLILFVLRTHMMNLHQFFFIAALISSIPLIIIRTHFYYGMLEKASTAHTSIKIYSGFYIAMGLFWFFSIVCMHVRNMPYSILLFLFSLAFAFKISIAAPIIYTNASSLSLYVGGEYIFIFSAVILYSIILILYFFYYMQLHIKKRIAFFEFFIMMIFIVATQLLLFSNSKVFNVFLSGILIGNSILNIKRYLIYKL